MPARHQHGGFLTGLKRFIRKATMLQFTCSRNVNGEGGVHTHWASGEEIKELYEESYKGGTYIVNLQLPLYGFKVRHPECGAVAFRRLCGLKAISPT